VAWGLALVGVGGVVAGIMVGRAAERQKEPV